jgi:2'-5' RNA ligase
MSTVWRSADPSGVSGVTLMHDLYTLAYPRLAEMDRAFIEKFRAEHDLRYRNVVAPHFTMAFGCSAVAEPQYLDHVEGVALSSGRLRFCCRYAMLGADHQDDTAYVFLVPDEGNSSLSRLHDRLYSGPLAPHLRLDIPYIPHITIGTVDDREAAKKLCDKLNENGILIEGSVDALTVAAFENGRIRDICCFRLQP